MIKRMITDTGRFTIDWLSDFGKAMAMFGRVLLNLRYIIRDRHLYFQQAMLIGVMSLPLVLLIGAFTGMVSTWQTNYSFNNILPVQYIGVATFKAVVVELGPVLCGLVLAGRVGSSLSAELATMRISEQIDALTVHAIDPIRYLVAPRLIAGVIMVPILVTLAVFVSLWGGFMIGYMFMNLGADTYFSEIPVFFKMKDIYVMLTKSCTFGTIICLVGTHVGITAKGGAAGVGKATIRSFVASALLILIADYILAMLMF